MIRVVASNSFRPRTSWPLPVEFWAGGLGFMNLLKQTLS
jgi:hypothetical protein